MLSCVLVVVMLVIGSEIASCLEVCTYLDVFGNTQEHTCSSHCCGDVHRSYCCLHRDFAVIVLGSIFCFLALVTIILIIVHCCIRRRLKRPPLRTYQSDVPYYGSLSPPVAFTGTPDVCNTSPVFAPDIQITVTPTSPTTTYTYTMGNENKPAGRVDNQPYSPTPAGVVDPVHDNMPYGQPDNQPYPSSIPVGAVEYPSGPSIPYGQPASIPAGAVEYPSGPSIPYGQPDNQPYGYDNQPYNPNAAGAYIQPDIPNVTHPAGIVLDDDQPFGNPSDYAPNGFHDAHHSIPAGSLYIEPNEDNYSFNSTPESFVCENNDDSEPY